MSDALTNAAAAALDAARKLKRLDRPLRLLDHSAVASPPGSYTTIATVKRGFSLTQGDNGITLSICESTEATASRLARCVAVAFDGKVYKLQGSDKVKPVGAPFMWKFNLGGTGESY